MLSVSRARSDMICDARNSSRRCTMSTLLANLERKSASSIAVSPPPTTMVGLSRKNAASLLEQSTPDEPLDHERAQIRARGVEGSRVAGGPTTDDDHVLWCAHLASAVTLLSEV